MSGIGYHWNEDDSRSAIRICYTKAPRPMNPHFQDEVELMYFFNTSGCTYLCSSNEIKVNSGETVVVNVGELHACNHWGNPCEAMCIILNLKRLNVPSLSERWFYNHIPQRDEIATVFERLKMTLSDDGCKGAERDCCVFECIYALIRNILSFSVPRGTETARRHHLELKRVLSFIGDHLSEKLSLEQLADLAHLSVDRFYHVFKEQVGISPTEYIVNERVTKACALLTETTLEVTDIAHECGFCSPSYFSKKFRKKMNVSPRQYRKMHL